MTLAVEIATEECGLLDLHAWTPQQVRRVVEAAPGDADGERAVAVLSPLFGFLVETGRWAGSPTALAGIREALDEVSPLAQQTRSLAAVIASPTPFRAQEDVAIHLR